MFFVAPEKFKIRDLTHLRIRQTIWFWLGDSFVFVFFFSVVFFNISTDCFTAIALAQEGVFEEKR